jgi:hypothetical protein
MKEETLKVEGNILATKILKTNMTEEIKREGKKEEKLPTTSTSHNYEDKIEEMTKLIKELSSKLAKMEIDGKNVNRPVQEGGNINPN